MLYKLQNSYYACQCGGTFSVDLRTQSYGIAPCIYNFVCDKCEKRKTMPCEAELKFLANLQEENFDAEFTLKG